MAYLHPVLLAAAIGVAIIPAGCAPGPMIDRLPGGMGLPAGTPDRPSSPYEYPAVHDMPAARATEPLSAEEQLKLEKDLANVRNRQAREVGGTSAEKAAPPAKSQMATSQTKKKKPADVIVVPPAGASIKP